MDQKPPTAVIESAHAEHLTGLPFDDTRDFDDADRGFIAALEPCVVTAADGRVVWDNDVYGFLTGDAPTSVHPSLWRQSTLAAKQGLYEVVEGIYQVRGLDLSNISFIEGDTGVIVIDPLISTETAAAALALYRAHRGDRPVSAVIYTHSHVDHFGGVLGVTSQADVDAGKVAVHRARGLHSSTPCRRTSTPAPRWRAGRPTCTAPCWRADRRGRSAAASGRHRRSARWPSSCRPSTSRTTGETHTIDGVEIEFQMAPGTEAPAEMHFYFPRYRALCMAENATHNLHNLLTLRGALVRDPHGWSGYLTEAIDTFSDRTDVVFASHHWPTWGKDRIVEFLSLQRDLYAYLHDQTLRLLNQGHTGIEIAETFQMPPALHRAWHTHGYYGSVSHNVKAVYQRYMGWFDGNPARLWPHPPEAIAPRYVEAMGGIDRVVETRAARPSTAVTSAGRQRYWITPSSPTRTTPGAQGAVRRHAGAAGLRRRERDVAQLLPLRCHRVARRQLRHADADDVAVDDVAADAGADVRQLRDQRQRAKGLGSRPRHRRHVQPTSATNYRLTLRNGVLVYRKVAADAVDRHRDGHGGEQVAAVDVRDGRHHVAGPRDHGRRRGAVGAARRARQAEPGLQHRHPLGDLCAVAVAQRLCAHKSRREGTRGGRRRRAGSTPS